MGYASRAKAQHVFDAMAPVCPECGRQVDVLVKITQKVDGTFDEACRQCEASWIAEGYLSPERRKAARG